MLTHLKELELSESYAIQEYGEKFFVCGRVVPRVVACLKTFNKGIHTPNVCAHHSQAAHRVGNQVFMEVPFLINGQKVSFVTKY